jgi:hypothetical protein
MTSISFPPAAEWQVDQVIAFDWYDGPRSGVCRFGRPDLEAHFELLAERATQNDLDDRLFYLRRLPKGSVENLETSLAQVCGVARRPVWVPMWPVQSQTADSLEQQVQTVLKAGQDIGVVLLTRDFGAILNVWEGQQRQSVDWFDYLGV